MAEPGHVWGVSREETDKARALRRRQTTAEDVLWQAIRGHKLAGLKFRRQQPMGPYIVDFYCLARNLVIEVDGEIHDQQQEYDAARTEYLEAHGATVMRFRNNEILDALPVVLDRIPAVVSSRLPSPRGRGAGGEEP